MRNKRNWLTLIMIHLFILFIVLLGGCSLDQHSQSQPKATNQSLNQEQKDKNQGNQEADQQQKQQFDTEQKKGDTIIINTPLPDSTVRLGMSFVLKGKAKLDVNELYYEFEDGHNILSKGKFPLSSKKDAAGFAEFNYTIKLEQNPSSPYGTLILYVLQKDGARTEQLMVTYKFDPSIVKP
ncbi:hypothetical protein [Tepidibacillus sp. LV47]|uniref:hypothetical protein n=1 Tax=Tepidibacillus sp. LV47 TaxID=3398228 RepID=UPI003AB01FBE